MSTSDSPRVSSLQRRPTGVPGLDIVLGGGLPAGDLLFIVGAPGIGKTILALQIAFSRVRAGAKVLLLTTFAESHDKLIAHLADLDFFDASVVGQQLQFLSILSMLDEGAEETTRSVVRTVRQQNIEMVIIDGFRGIRNAFTSEFATRQFLQLLGTQLAYLGTTLVITIEANVDSGDPYSELTTGDSIIGLRRDLMGRQHRRLLEVHKLRGQAPLPGTHRYSITRSGVHVYPRLESLNVEALPLLPSGRATFDVPGLDAMLNGGVTTSTATLIGGSPGTGKTLLGLHYVLAGAASGEEALFVTLHESEDQLFEKAQALGLDLEAPVRSGVIRIIRRPPVELDVDELVDTIRQDLICRPVRRLVFDGLSSLQHALDKEDRAQDYLGAMVEMLRARRVTSLFLIEVAKLAGGDLDFANTPLYVLGANMLLLRQVEYLSRLHRIIWVAKARFSDYDQTIREFTIGPRGVEVGEPLMDVEAQLTGIGRSRTGGDAGRGKRGGNSRGGGR